MKIMEIGQFELGQEVKVLFPSGNAVEGKVIDFTDSQSLIWVENSEDVFQVNMYHASIFLKEQEQKIPTPEANGFKSLAEVKAEIKTELSELWNQGIESVKVMVFNDETSVYDGYEELGRVECWDCEVQIRTEGDELIPIYFGQFFNEKDALKHARTMRTKLKRTYDISEQVFVYSC